MIVTFSPPKSSVDPSFWEELYNKKINVYKLSANEEPISVSHSFQSGSMLLDKSSFDVSVGQHSHLRSPGIMLNMNTLKDFKECDKKVLLESAATTILSAIHSGTAIQFPNILYSCVLLVFADLKQYQFTFWFGQPAIVPVHSITASSSVLLREAQIPFRVGLINSLYQGVSCCLDMKDQPIFGLLPLQRHSDQDLTAEELEFSKVSLSQPPSPAVQHSHRVVSLAEAWPHRYKKSTFLVYIDQTAQVSSSEQTSSSSFTWPMRNLLALLCAHHPQSDPPSPASSSRSIDADSPCGDSVNLIAWRNSAAAAFFRSHQRNNEISLQSSSAVADNAEWVVNTHVDTDESVLIRPNLTFLDTSNAHDHIKIVGWEPNEKGKPAPRFADLRPLLDSAALMTQAVDLNLRLMRWRLWPSLDTEKLSKTKCLLLGAGTLGCAVARALLGWGVRTITLVDNGRVSYSNPARQCLFEFRDAESGRFKSVAAADALKRVWGDVEASGVVMTIPMPGHPLAPSEESAVQELDRLVREHDVVFALTDSREARWLPATLCAAHDKLMINAALGFDSYLVMRHGFGVPVAGEELNCNDESAYERLGCYFCNDIVAAVNSMKDRTLDQQCTVTRPGLSFIASALAAELMVAVLQSPLGMRHPASDKPLLQSKTKGNAISLNPSYSDLTPIPHQIRGSVDSFTQFLPATPSFNCCTACSVPVVAEYRRNGAEFVKLVCEDTSGKLLESLSGVAQMNADAECALEKYRRKNSSVDRDGGDGFFDDWEEDVDEER